MAKNHVSEEVERALAKLVQPKLTGRSSPQRIEGPGGRKLQLHFRSRLPPHLFTGAKVDQGTSIHIILLVAVTNTVISFGSEAVAKLSVVVLEGNFNDENDSKWTQYHFESFEVKEREGKIKATSDRKFRLGVKGVKVADGFSEDIHIREAKSEAFAVLRIIEENVD
ncbi:uncharacterized protein A4U43_C01F860 [Asparagus officinalis]|uniref:Calmodulin binding protein-like N-terminal domain-containing protein n=1 Tax=Asparagus officinalis TaxID=4686 RepID=A0A5P1FKQ6_ASPOF|nr:uncharacterized protein A4U43_C01F860 [Asparagus officinalis]